MQRIELIRNFKLKEFTIKDKIFNGVEISILFDDTMHGYCIKLTPILILTLGVIKHDDSYIRKLLYSTKRTKEEYSKVIDTYNRLHELIISLFTKELNIKYINKEQYKYLRIKNTV